VSGGGGGGGGEAKRWGAAARQGRLEGGRRLREAQGERRGRWDKTRRDESSRLFFCEGNGDEAGSAADGGGGGRGEEERIALVVMEAAAAAGVAERSEGNGCWRIVAPLAIK